MKRHNSENQTELNTELDNGAPSRRRALTLLGLSGGGGGDDGGSGGGGSGGDDGADAGSADASAGSPEHAAGSPADNSHPSQDQTANATGEIVGLDDPQDPTH